MFETMLYFWLGFGAVLIIGEMVLPGLVSVFLGLGALTVAAMMHFGHIDNLAHQLITWFISSTVYIFSLRLVVVRYYPSDKEKLNINEDEAMIGQVVEVVETIPKGKSGRIRHGGSAWPARSNSEDDIKKGEQVQIKGRKNISWIVERELIKEKTKEES